MPSTRKIVESHTVEPPFIIYEGKKLLNFSSNDYLGLAKHPKLIEKSIEAARQFGTSSSSSRVLTGTHPLHKQIEEGLKKLIGKESLLFNSGYQANLGLLQSFDTGTLLLDHSCHRSLIEGALASKARMMRFRHNDMSHLELLLKKAAEPIWIVTESIFSMEGDLSPLDEIIYLKNRYNAHLIVDDAHAVGVAGKSGMGLAARVEDIDISIATFGKALGAFGAFIACSQETKDSLIQRCPSFIYTTALPPPVLGAIDASLELIPTLDKERGHLQNLYMMMGGQSPIIPYPVGDAKKAVEISERLKEKGLLALPIRPPTVQRSILRLSLTTGHTKEHLTHLNSLLHHLVQANHAGRI
jgi:8-amino-7-oxononanoate synthase